MYGNSMNPPQKPALSFGFVVANQLDIELELVCLTFLNGIREKLQRSEKIRNQLHFPFALDSAIYAGNNRHDSKYFSSKGCLEVQFQFSLLVCV